ncbi:hypothetical protein OAK75_02960 [Bacteriovoracales bacterium]|nr:hypothetical protein [Bacteriovoracales bacterium]
MQKLYTLPIGLIEFTQDEKGKSQLGLVTPEIIRMLAGTKFIDNLDSLNPYIENNKSLQELSTILKQESLLLLVGGKGESKYIFLIDKGRLLKSSTKITREK